MRKLFLIPSVLVLGIAAMAQDAPAQVRRPAGPSLRRSTRPTTSPYLNLLNRNNGVGYNYYQRVRPEVEIRKQGNQLQGSLDSLQRQVNQQQQQITQSSASTLSQTGHAATFMSFGNYFPGRR